MERSYRIADLVINMDTWGIAEVHARPYEIEYTDKPELVVTNEWEYKEKFRGPGSFVEYTATAANFYHKLLDHNGFLLHSSAVIMDGKAYLFTADAGTGKSTHSSLYRRVFGDDRARILNDDKPALRLVDGKFYAYGTPWSGKTDMNLNLRVPIGGICWLRRGEENKIRKMSDREALFCLLGQTIRPADPKQMDKLLELLNELLKQTQVWEMYCNISPEAAVVSYEAMSGSGKENA